MSDQIHNLNYLKQARRDLRKNSTPQEIILWQQLRKQNLGCVFKRQESMGNFIIDFYCPAKKLAIEVDGSQHLDNKEADQERTNYLESLGVKVIRFWNNEVNTNLNGVMMKIQEEINIKN